MFVGDHKLIYDLDLCSVSNINRAKIKLASVFLTA